MSSLITVNKMTSMQIAEIIKKQHQHIMRDIRDEVEKLSNAGIETESKFGLRERVGLTGRIPYYELTEEGVLQLAARYDAVTRAKLIELAMKQEKQLPSNYKEALLALVAAEEERELLQADNEQKALQLEQQKPKVIFADAVSVSKTCILIGDLAKLLKQNGVETGQKRLFEWLRVNGYLIKRQGADYNSPTQKAMELGLFEVKETSITHSDGHVSISKTTKVTGKGQQYFINKFLAECNSILN